MSISSASLCIPQPHWAMASMCAPQPHCVLSTPLCVLYPHCVLSSLTMSSLATLWAPQPHCDLLTLSVSISTSLCAPQPHCELSDLSVPQPHWSTSASLGATPSLPTAHLHWQHFSLCCDQQPDCEHCRHPLNTTEVLGTGVSKSNLTIQDQPHWTLN